MTPEEIHQVRMRRDRVRAAFANYIAGGTGHDAKLLAEDVTILLDDSVKLTALEQAGYGIEEIRRLDGEIEKLRAQLKEQPPCVIGRYCERHHGTHGQEAEELRAGLEKILTDSPGDRPPSGHVLRAAIRRVIDETDARDSLGFLEAGDELEALRDVFAIVNEWKRHVDAQPAPLVFPGGSLGDRLTKAIERVRDIACTEADFACAIPGCLHHAHPGCPCGHPPDVTGPCGGCNCCDPAP